MSTTDGGSAYPYVVVTKVDGETGSPVRQEVQTGVSIRDYFAAHALVMLSTAEVLKALCDEGRATSITDSALIGRAVYEIADAMLAERERHR